MENFTKSKLQMMIEKLESHIDLLACPICGSTFSLAGHTIVCENKHSFDISKKGYINLSKSKGGGFYSKDLYEARRKVFESGLFAPAAKRLAALCQAAYGGLRSPGTLGDIALLDAGCGEGYFTSVCEEGLRQGPAFGLDIEKSAIALSTTYTRPIFVVADLARLPFSSNSVDVILNILSPANYKEFGRVARPNARLIKVIPGADYLVELRDLIESDKEQTAGIVEDCNSRDGKDSRDSRDSGGSENSRGSEVSRDSEVSEASEIGEVDREIMVNYGKVSQPADTLNYNMSKLKAPKVEKLRYSQAVSSELRHYLFKMTPMSVHSDVSEEQVEKLENITIDLDIIVGGL